MARDAKIMSAAYRQYQQDRDARRLEDMGHIRREISPHDRRQYQLFLTGAGGEMLEKLQHIYDGFQERLSAGVSQEDWETLRSLLARLEENSCRESPGA